MISVFLLILFYVVGVHCQTPCTVPSGVIMSMFSIENGKETYTESQAQGLISQNNYFDGLCYQVSNNSAPYPNADADYLIIYKNRTSNCFFCYRWLPRSNYVIQYVHSQCSTDLSGLCDNIVNLEFDTGFARARSQSIDFNCKRIVEGVFQFNYKITDYSGICDQPDNLIRACQQQGSPLRDNNVFTMNFKFCPQIDPSKSGGNIKYVPHDFTWRCYGQWFDATKNVWGALEFDTLEEKFRFRCIITRIDQQDPTKQTWGISSDASCKTLDNGIIRAPIRIEAKPALDPLVNIKDLEPTCKLPTNFTGNWFYPSEFTTTVVINATHIYYRRKINQDRYEEIYFVCKQVQESRYLMATITKGKCDLDYTCFHFLPRHQNIVRFRMSRPFGKRPWKGAATTLPVFDMTKMFREACHWNSFTLNYVDWVYEYFILNPPVPVNCPIQGRYWFKQIGQPQEWYYTKIPFGMTPRPRMQVVCNTSLEPAINSCYENPKQLYLDVERCMRLDFTGRPISEYDIADNVLTCVGYWMEDTKSFLVTFDMEDPVNYNFRCWVYRRLDLSTYLMSRSQGTHCSKRQVAESAYPDQGASLGLELMQNELEFDGCPMSYDDGHDPYENPYVFRVYAGSSALRWSLVATLVFALVSICAIR